MRLIDADRLIDEFEDTIGNPISRTRLKLQVQNQPTVDAVEVVRCIDCKWCSEDYDTDGNVPYWTCKNWDCGTDADGFCHEAERKNDG